ncbi:MAG: AraC family transcriptional regulator [Chitinophagaceae bacterium]|nr:MAG: AraC family transcriptional regulator [Chitinophagaceae bacterium]
MQHVEIIDKEHFEKNYHRVKPSRSVAHFIDFYWQTKFDHLWDLHPEGFSDALFPNIGYTYLVNLGTPFVMQVGKKKFDMKTDGFLPRHQSIECFHQAGNCLFGIKFKISPIIFEKKVNFSEYNDSIFPLSYLLEKQVLDALKQPSTFNERVNQLNSYYGAIIKRFEGSVLPISIVSEIIDNCCKSMAFNDSIEEMAAKYSISSRTLQRYFEKCTSLSTKKTLQILRIRKAVEQMASDPANFNFNQYGYYDYSHFYKHLQQFLPRAVLQKLNKDLRRH